MQKKKARGRTQKWFILSVVLSFYLALFPYRCAESKQVEKKQATTQQKSPAQAAEIGPQEPLTKAWYEANEAISDMYYCDLIDKNPDANVKTQWQGAIGLVFKTLDIFRKGTHPSEGIGGEGVEVVTLLPYFTETQGQMRNALDQIYTTRGMASSLDGRGRAILPQMELLYQQLENIRIALAQRNLAAYERACESIFHLVQFLHARVLGLPPPKYADVVEPFPAKEIGGAIRSGTPFVMLVTILVFLGTFFFMRLPQIGIADHAVSLLEYWKEHLKKLAYEYNRQFLAVGAGWLLYGPLIVSVIFGLLTMSLWVFILAAVIFGYLLPTEGLKFVKERRRMRIETQLLDAMILLSDAMKSGLDLVQGLELAVHEMAPPISEEFDLLLKNYRLGTPFDEALKGMEQRVESDLLSYVVRAVIIQRQAGGNLTKIFDRIVDTIREESKLKDKINALTAGPRLQSVVISVIPWGMLMILYFFQPKAVGTFYTSLAGVITLLLCVLLQILGLITIRRMARIEV